MNWVTRRSPNNDLRTSHDHASTGHVRAKQTVVEAPIERAFSVFTQGVGSEGGRPLYLERFAGLLRN